MSKGKRGSKIEDAESIGKTLQERKSSGPTEADYKRMYDQVQAGHLTQRQAAVELGTSKGDIWRHFQELEKSETGSGAKGKAPKAESPSLDVQSPPQVQEHASLVKSPTLPKIEIGIQYLPIERLDNTRYQPRAIIKAPADLILDMKIRGGNIYPVLVQASTGAVMDGHRRVDAIMRINAEHPKKPLLLVKCDVQDLTDQEAALLAYQANILSSPLSEGERDKWIYSLMGVYNLSTKQICDETGLSESTLSNIRRAFEKTTDAVKERLESGKISTGVAIALASLEPAQQTRLAKKTESKQLSVQAVKDEASEIRGRTEARKKIHQHLYDMKPRLVGTIEMEDREKWREKVLKDTFGTPYSHHESGHLVTLGDVAAAEKMLGITVTEKKVAIALCKTCVFEQDKKCEFGHKMPRSACEHHLLSQFPNSSYKPPVKCPICGGWTMDAVLKGEKVEIDRYTHEACILARIIEKGGLSGVCTECSHACRTARSVIRESYEPGIARVGAITKRATVTECSEMKPKTDIAALNARAEQRVMEAIAKFHRDDKTIAENHQIEHAREVVERSDLAKQVAKATAPEPEPAKGTVEAGAMRPRSPAEFRESAAPKSEAPA